MLSFNFNKKKKIGVREVVLVGNEPGGHACMHIWRLLWGSIPRCPVAPQD